MKVLFFASIAEMTKMNSMEVAAPENINQLRTILEAKFPQLPSLNYSVALNQTIIHHNSNLTDQDEVALLPPFSGG